MGRRVQKGTAAKAFALEAKHKAARKRRAKAGGNCGSGGCLCRACIEERREAFALMVGPNPSPMDRAIMDMDPIGADDRSENVHHVSHTIQGGKIIATRRYRIGECKRPNCVHCVLERVEAAEALEAARAVAP